MAEEPDDRSPRLKQAAAENLATEKEMNASLMVFEAACMRGDNGYINRASEAAHAALENHLQAKAAIYAIAREEYPE